LPDFLIIGAQKCGTTSLWNYLLKHPNILPNYDNRKEIQYFDQKMKKGINWYKAHFPTKRAIEQKKKEIGCGKVLVGEATTHYIFHPRVARAVKEVMPKVKIVVLLRDPISRAYSHYHHEVREKREKLPFEIAVEQESIRLKGSYEMILKNPYYFNQIRHDHSYLERGKYFDQLTRWYDCFPSNQILVLKSEDLFQKPMNFCKKVLEFLELPFYEKIEFEKINYGAYKKMNPSINKRLKEIF
tara:strand:+ start:157 stop:882 length:726 start_codon:yes stop_codon:yes gene_type:complete